MARETHLVVAFAAKGRSDCQTFQLPPAATYLDHSVRVTTARPPDNGTRSTEGWRIDVTLVRHGPDHRVRALIVEVRAKPTRLPGADNFIGIEVAVVYEMR